MLPEFLATVEAAGPDDPARRRLNPTVYGEERPEFDATTIELLTEARAVDREIFLASCRLVETGEPLTVADAEAWMKVIGEARLALAARLGIVDSWESREPEDPAHGLLLALTEVQDRLVDTVMEFL